MSAAMSIMTAGTSCVFNWLVDEFLVCDIYLGGGGQGSSFFGTWAVAVKTGVVPFPFQEGGMVGVMGKMTVGALGAGIERIMFMEGSFIFFLYILMTLKACDTCFFFEQIRKTAAMRLVTGGAVELTDG